MERFGIMTLNEQSENNYFTEIAKRGSVLGIVCYRFIPSNIDPITHEVSGSIFDSNLNQWKHGTFAIPNVLYDRCFYSEDTHSKQCKSIVSWLKNRQDVFFLGYGLPNKLELYNVLKQSPLSPYLPSTKLITNSSNVIEELSNYQRIVLKPINGSQGNGIFYIQFGTSSIKVKTYNRNSHIQKEFHDEKTFLYWIEQLINKKEYLLQPYLELTNENDEPFDVRILLQKSDAENWSEQGRGLRIGHPDGILSNLSAGGRIEGFNIWKNRLSFMQREFIETEIEDILLKVPHVLEETFLPLFELGLDIGITKFGSIWILDINSKPGRKVILETNKENIDRLYNAPILYGKTILSRENIERKRYDAKTLSY